MTTTDSKNTSSGSRPLRPTPIASLLKRIPLYDALKRARQEGEASRVIKNWEAQGRPGRPPQPFKVETIMHYARLFGTKTFVETGTFHGYTTYRLKDLFTKLYTIELDQYLHAKAKRAFARFPQVQPLQGDSGEVISRVLAELNEPALFWLDAHYSAGETARGSLDTPIVEEMRRILGHRVKDHVILIDDRREFNGTNDYPKLEDFREFILKDGTYSCFSDRHDIIRIHN